MIQIELFEVVQKRKSIRSYEPTPIPKEVMERIMESARISPSASNKQPWHFIVVTDAEKKKALSKGTYAKFVHEAPVVIVACGDEKISPNWCIIDTTIATQTMVLTATAECLGTCWVGSFDEASVRKLLEIPNHLRVVALLPIGYPKEKLDLVQVVMKGRKSLKEIVSGDKFGGKYP